MIKVNEINMVISPLIIFVYKVFRVHSNSKPVFLTAGLRGDYLSSRVPPVDEIQVLYQRYAKFCLMLRRRKPFSNIGYE